VLGPSWVLEHAGRPLAGSHLRCVSVNGHRVGDFKNEKPTVWSSSDALKAGDMQENPTRKLQAFSGSFWFRALRVMAGFMVLMAGVAITFGCVAALLGDPEMLVDFIDEDKLSLEMTPLAIAAVISTNVLALTSLGMLFFSLNRFLSLAERGELLIASARNALKRIGVAMILLYVTSRFLAVGIPLAGMDGFWEEYSWSVVVSFLDLDFLYLLVGVVLLALRQALYEGQAAKEEVRQYV